MIVWFSPRVSRVCEQGQQHDDCMDKICHYDCVILFRVSSLWTQEISGVCGQEKYVMHFLFRVSEVCGQEKYHVMYFLLRVSGVCGQDRGTECGVHWSTGGCGHRCLHPGVLVADWCRLVTGWSACLSAFVSPVLVNNVLGPLHAYTPHTHTHTHTHTHVLTHTYMQTPTQTQMHVHTNLYNHTHLHTYFFFFFQSYIFHWWLFLWT